VQRLLTKTCLIVAIGLVLSLSLSASDRVPPGSDDTVRERLAPFGTVCKDGDPCASASQVSAGGAPRSGQQIYDTSCFICHAAGVGGAPIFQDTEQWAPRIAKGLDSLWNSTANGVNAMPPRGTCVDCSDEELRAAMDYMLESI